MEILEIILIGIAVAVDAVAVGMANGMQEPRMPARKALAIALTFGGFQFGMPVLGYFLGAAFSALVEKIAPYLSFALLALLGGKMIAGGVRELRQGRKLLTAWEPLGIGKLLVQGVATSLDALAVGVTLLAAESTAGLPFHACLCALLIGTITFLMSLAAVEAGRKLGAALTKGAELLGGIVLLLIGAKILLEGIL